MDAEPSIDELEARGARAREAGERAAALRPRLERAIRARGAARTRLEEAVEWRWRWFGLAAIWPWVPFPRVGASRRALGEAIAAEDALRRELAAAEAEAGGAAAIDALRLERRLAAAGEEGAAGASALEAARAALARLRAREAELAAVERDLREALDALESALAPRATGEGSPLRGSAAPPVSPREAARAAERARGPLERSASSPCAEEVGAPHPRDLEGVRSGGDAFTALAHAARVAFHRAGELRQLSIAAADREARSLDALQARLLASPRAGGGGRP